jgi:hypothetical protein
MSKKMSLQKENKSKKKFEKAKKKNKKSKFFLECFFCC